MRVAVKVAVAVAVGIVACLLASLSFFWSRRNLFADNRLELFDIGRKSTNPCRKLFGRHGVHAHHHSEFCLVDIDLGNVHRDGFGGVQEFCDGCCCLLDRLVLEFLDEFGRNRKSVAAGQLNDFVDVSKGGTHDNGVVSVFFVVVVDFRHRDHTGIGCRLESWKVFVFGQFFFFVVIHDASDKGRNKGDAHLGAGNGLGQAKNECQVAGDSLCFQDLGGLNALPGGGNLDEDAGLVDSLFLVELDEGSGLFDGRLGVKGKTGVDLRRDVSGNDLGDLDSKVYRDLVLLNCAMNECMKWNGIK